MAAFLLFLKAIFGWIFKNPIPVLIVIALAVFGWTWFDNQRLKKENEAIKDEIALVVDKQEVTQDNIVRVDDIQNEIARIRQGQADIRNRIDEIQVTEEDRPFANNPGLLDRVDVMRDHQQSVPRE